MERTGDRGGWGRADRGTPVFAADWQANQCGIPLRLVDPAGQYYDAGACRTEAATGCRCGPAVGGTRAASITCAGVGGGEEAAGAEACGGTGADRPGSP